MSMQSLERAVLAGAKELFNNPKLRMKDLMEWSTGDVKAQPGEVAAYVKNPGVNVVIAAEHDKRKK